MSRRIWLAVIVGAVSLAAAAWFRAPSRPQETPEALYEKALASLNANRSDGVQEAFDRLKSDRNYWRHLAVLDAVLFLRGGRPAEALNRLATVPEETPVREESLLYAGEAFYSLQQLGEAQQVFQMLRSEFPDSVDARRWLGAIYYDLGAYDAAITEMEAVAKHEPDDYRPHHLLGVMYQDFEADEDAIRHFRMAMERTPPAEVMTQISADLARVLVRNRQYDEAAAILDSLPQSQTSLELQARTCWGRGAAEDAQQLLDKAQEHGELSPDGLQLKADLEEARDDLTSAVATMEKLLNDFPDRIEARYQLALLLQQNGQKEEGAEQLETWKTQRDLADQLIQWNLKAVMDPHDAEVRDRLAEICRQLGRTRLAEMWQKAAEACRRGRVPKTG